MRNRILASWKLFSDGSNFWSVRVSIACNETVHVHDNIFQFFIYMRVNVYEFVYENEKCVFRPVRTRQMVNKAWRSGNVGGVAMLTCKSFRKLGEGAKDKLNHPVAHSLRSVPQESWS